jgi:aminoglycoside 6-adenylyltransferase
MMTYEQLEARVTAWAATQPTIRAVIVCGSRARGDADRWSDLDLILFTTDRELLAADSDWLARFGDLWLVYPEPTDPGDFEWYALYAGGLKLDVVLLSVDDPALELDLLLKLYPYQGVFGRGIKVLFDRLGSPRTIPPKSFVPSPPPTTEQFGQVVNGFLMATATTAKFIARGDLWRAQRWFANDLRRHLLTLIEWQADGKDTWYAGRFFETWADARVRAALPQIFPGYDQQDMKHALRASLDHFHWLGKETAARFGFTYPETTHERIAALVETIFNGA